MIRFASLSYFAYSVFGCWVFFLFLGMVFLMVSEFSKNRKMHFVKILLFPTGILISYIMLQCILGANDKMLSHPTIIRMVTGFSNLPALFVFLLCLLLTAGEVILLIQNLRWNRTHITAISLKEAVDSLPAGVCAYEDSGRIMLKNTVMDNISISLTGDVLLNGLLLEDEMNKYPRTDTMGRKRIFILPDNSVYIFSRETLEEQGYKLTLLTAFDMTEEYEKTRILLRKRKDVSELNSRLVTYNRDIVSIITSQEILNAKVKIHDELGAGLLAIRHYLTSGGGDEEKNEIIEKLNHNLKFLQSETAENKQDEYILMFTTANALDVRIATDGSLPQDEPNKHIIATAIHECFTNTVRHAKGDLLRIQVQDNDGTAYLTVIFTNNGIQPTEKIIEKGGLASLRSMVETACGTMDIEIKNGFELRICLPKDKD